MVIWGLLDIIVVVMIMIITGVINAVYLLIFKKPQRKAKAGTCMWSAVHTAKMQTVSQRRARGSICEENLTGFLLEK